MESKKIFYEISFFEGDGKKKKNSVWKRQISAIIAAKELEDILEREPAEDRTVDTMKAKKAYPPLLSLLSDGILESVQDENTVHKICNKSEQTCDTNQAVNQNLIRKKLATINKDRAMSMRSHIDEINKLISDLKLSMDCCLYFDVVAPRI